jgi:hypothetical protein
MSKKALAIGLTLSLVLSGAPTFAQGKGVGVGVGSKSQAGVKTDTDVKAKTSTEVKTKEVKQAGTPDKGHAQSTTLASKIQADPALSTKVSALLPTGVSMSDAAAGFKTQGQFIAALHVSKNLNIPFDQLKTKMMTGPESMSLGAAIKASRPEMSEQKANEEAKKAEKEAKETEKK